MNARPPMHAYQEYAVDFVLSHPYCGLFFDCGLGKTRITLEAILRLNPRHHVLVVAPKTIARSAWIEEIRKWDMPLRTVSLVVDKKDRPLTRKKRLALYDAIPTSPPAVYFINRDLFYDLVRHFCDQKDPIWYFPMIVLDEAQGFKNCSSERFKAMKRIRPAVSRVIELTGTPTPKGLEDLWSLIYILDRGARLGQTISAYRDVWFTPGIHVNNIPVTWNPKRGAKEDIYRRISDIVVSMENQVKLPPLQITEVPVYLDPSEMKKYKSFARDSVLEIAPDRAVTASNAAVLQSKLSQMASGAIYTDPKSKSFELIHSRKLDVLEYIISMTSGPVLVAYWYKSDLDMITARIPDAAAFDGSAAMIRDWNAGRIPVMLLQPASAGYGINLQEGGHTLVWYTLPWSLECHDQTFKRLYRQGQESPVDMYYLLTQNTVDTHVLSMVRKKHDTQQELLDAVKASVDQIFDA